MIKQEVIEDILNAARIEEVVGDFVRLSRRGVNHIGLCPFHNEKTPSFTVSSAKGIFKCFGCGAGGDSVGFIMKHENYSYVEALRYLANKYNIEIKEEAQTPEQIKELNEREVLYSVLSFAKNYFIQTLFNTEEGKSLGLSYFKERGFSAATVEKFQLGYALQERDAFTQNALKNGYTLDNLEKAGLSTLKENNYCSDRFRGRVIFPIQNFSGKVIGFGGRILSSLQSANSAKYINSPETAVYHKSDVLYGLYLAKTAIKKEDCCLLVEGYTDVISLFQSGIENVVSSSGTSLTTGQIKLIRKLTDNITIVYDGDSAGIKAALRGISLILQEGMNVRVVLLPEGEDPDSFARNNTKEDCLSYIREHEESFIRFKVRLLLKEVGNDPMRKSKLVNEIAGDIALVRDGITASFFIKECATLLDVSEEVLAQTVGKLKVKNYYDQRSKESKDNNDDKGNNEQEDKEIFIKAFSPEVSSPQIFVRRMPVEDVERVIIHHLINYGDRVLPLQFSDKEEAVDVRIDQFIFDDLCNNGIIFENPLHRKFFYEYATVAESKPDNITLKLRQHQEEDIRNLCLELIHIPIPMSPLWESDRIKNYINCIYNDESKLLEDVIRTLQMLKLVKIKLLHLAKQEQLKTASTEDDEMILLHEIKTLKDKINEIEAVLGTAYRWD
jgi:DNA primase